MDFPDLPPDVPPFRHQKVPKGPPAELPKNLGALLRHVLRIVCAAVVLAAAWWMFEALR
jgi:hypothetical protein